MKRPEEIKQEIVKGWLRKADQDLAAAEALLSRTPPLLSPSCFHCQQAVEKYLKGFLTLYQVEYPKTHDIVEFLDLLGKIDGKLAESLEDIFCPSIQIEGGLPLLPLFPPT